uniref:Terpene synthase 9 n=1 Tax=Taiwania cryptomerioides TaxID=50187 RepID=A0A6B8MS60_TAICR|nr:terpene synthase 9 [Taiwania cryptomerioides]
MAILDGVGDEVSASASASASVCASIPDNAFNHWDDDFIQSMETPYGDSEYRERAETLVKDVKILLREMQTGGVDLIERLEMVDALQCLGIDRYFDAEIKATLDCAYRSWDTSVGIRLGSKNVTRDLNATALALRLLRLHRYDVSADVLESFKDKNEQFFSGENNDNNTGEECVMRSMLNLLRASSVAFPREKVMEEVKAFSSAYLKILSENSRDVYKRGLLKEVEYALIYDWPRTFTRWEARNFIEIYELDDLRLKDTRILELAKLDFNILQFTYKMEMKYLSRWWANSGLSKLIATRERTIEFLLWGVSSTDEVNFSTCRIALAKASTLATIMDDILDDYGTFEQLKLIKEAIVQGWDISIVKNIPENIKMCLEFVFKAVHELVDEANKMQGRDMMPFITKAWADCIEAGLEQARWRRSGYVPIYNEYLNTATTSAFIGPILLHVILLAAPISRDDAIKKTFLNKSRFYELIWMCIRLIDDTRDFEDERHHGDNASAISCYMRDHIECSEAEALNHITNLIEEFLKELTWEYLNPNNALLDWEKICFNFNRGLQFIYIFGDGFTYSHKEIKDQVLKVVVNPVDL